MADITPELKIQITGEAPSAAKVAEEQLGELKQELEGPEMNAVKEALGKTFEKDKDNIIKLTKEQLAQLIAQLSAEKHDENSVPGQETHDDAGDKLSANEIQTAVDAIKTKETPVDIEPKPPVPPVEPPTQPDGGNEVKEPLGKTLAKGIKDMIPGITATLHNLIKNLPRMLEDFITGLRISFSGDKMKSKTGINLMSTIVAGAIQKNGFTENAAIINKSSLAEKEKIFDAMRGASGLDMSSENAQRDVAIFIENITKGMPEPAQISDIVALIAANAGKFGEIVQKGQPQPEKKDEKKEENEQGIKDKVFAETIEKIKIKKAGKESAFMDEKVGDLVAKKMYHSYDNSDTAIPFDSEKPFSQCTLWEIASMEELLKDTKEDLQSKLIKTVAKYFSELPEDKKKQLAEDQKMTLKTVLEKIKNVPIEPAPGDTPAPEKPTESTQKEIPLNPKDEKNIIFYNKKLFQWDSSSNTYKEMAFLNKELKPLGSDLDIKNPLPEGARGITYKGANELLSKRSDNGVNQAGWMYIDESFFGNLLKPLMGEELMPQDTDTYLVGTNNKIYKWDNDAYYEIEKTTEGLGFKKDGDKIYNKETSQETYANFQYAVTTSILKGLSSWDSIDKQISSADVHMIHPTLTPQEEERYGW